MRWVDCCYYVCDCNGIISDPFACTASIQIQRIACEIGQRWRFEPWTEETVNRDPYRSIKSETEPEGEEDFAVLMPVFPAAFEPKQRENERAGVRSEGNVELWTPAIAWLKAGFRYEDIDAIRWKVTHEGTSASAPRGRTFDVLSFRPENMVGDTYLYWVFSLRSE